MVCLENFIDYVNNIDVTVKFIFAGINFIEIVDINNHSREDVMVFGKGTHTQPLSWRDLCEEKKHSNR